MRRSAHNNIASSSAASTASPVTTVSSLSASNSNNGLPAARRASFRNDFRSSLTALGAVTSSSAHFLSSSSDPLQQQQQPPEVIPNPEFPSLVRVSSRRNTQILTQGLTLNKLQFSPIHLYGRSNDIQTCRNFLNEDASKKTFLLISGESGVGKTALARKVVSTTTTCFTFTMRGSFEETQQTKPYSAIADAVAELCGGILRLDDSAGVKKRIRTDMASDDFAGLVESMPILREIISDDSSASFNKAEAAVQQTTMPQLSGTVTEERKNRFHQAFRKFLRLVMEAEPFAPLSVILDDLQWADESSLELLASIFLDPHLSNIAVVATCRPEGLEMNSENELSPVNMLMEKVQKNEAQHGCKCLHHNIANLTVPDVVEMLQDLLRADEGQVLGLAKLCHRKTNGNAFFLKQYLWILNERQLMEFNLGTLSWTWNEAEIEKNTQAADNVVKMMQDSMDELPEEVVAVLQLAACLGASFDISTLRIIWMEYVQNRQAVEGNKPMESNELDHHVRYAIEKGFFVQSHETSSRKPSSGDDVHLTGKLLWVHCKLLESAIGYIPEGDQRKLRATVGAILHKRLDFSDLEGGIFVVVDLLNDGNKEAHCPVMGIDWIEMARLNLLAVEKGIGMAAFECAAKYADRGIQYLEGREERWDPEYRSVTLRLYVLSAELESITGQVVKAQSRANEVVGRSEIEQEDKSAAYFILTQKPYLENRMKEAKSLLQDVLAKLGYRFPRSRSVALGASVACLFKIKRIVNERITHETENLPVLTNSRKLNTIRLLDRLMTVCYFLKDPLTLPVLLRIHQFTRKYGVSQYAPPNMVAMGLILAGVLADFENAQILAGNALAMTSQFADRSAVARVYSIAWGGVLHFTKPIYAVLKPLQLGYEIGMAQGDFVRALSCLHLYLQGALVAGRPLPQLESEYHLFVGEMRNFHQDLLAESATLLWRLIAALRGQDREGVESYSSEPPSADNVVHQAYFDTFRLQQSVLFQDFEAAVKLADRNKPVSKAVPGCCLCYSDYLYRAIAYFEVSRHGKVNRRHCRKAARRILTMLQKWVEKGNPNVQHHEALLEAEWAALQGKKIPLVRKHYDVAVVLSLRQGFIQDAALAQERYGQFLVDMNEREDAAYHLREAVRLYSEWGAHAKANHMTEKYAELRNVPETVVAVR